MEEDLAREDDHNPSSPNLELVQNLSPRDVRYLVHAEEELSQTKVSKLVPCIAHQARVVHLRVLTVCCNPSCSVSGFQEDLAHKDVAPIFRPL